MTKVPDYRAQLTAERAELQPAIDALATLPALDADHKQRADELAAYRATPTQSRYSRLPDEISMDLQRQEMEARKLRDRTRQRGDDAQRRVNEIDALLAANDDVRRFTEEQATIFESGHLAETKARNTAALLATIKVEVGFAEKKHADEIASEETEMFRARQEGREFKPSKSRNENQDTTRLRGQVSAGERELAALRETMNNLTARSKEVADALHYAKQLAARVALAQMWLDNAGTVIEAQAFEHGHIEVARDDIAVAARRSEIVAECVPWRPSPESEPIQEASDRTMATDAPSEALA